MKKNGARLLVDLLQSHGVEIVFGYPGGSVLPLYDELLQASMQHILVRHEQGAMHMAEGYARVTGKPGVALVTSGPGATNTVTGLLNARLDSIPLFVMTGQVGTHMIGTDAFQEADIFGISIPVTKYNALIKDVNHLAETFDECWHLCQEGRPGPVLMDLPKDVFTNSTEKLHGEHKLPPRFCKKPEINGALEPFVDALNRAERPLLIVGGGAISADVSAEILLLAEKGMIPVTTTLMGIGAFPGTHLLNTGMAGMHGTAVANRAILECDYLLSLGSRFDDRVAGNERDFAVDAVRAHIDIDSAEFNKRVAVDYLLHGDLKDALLKILPMVEQKDRSGWVNHLDEYRRLYPLCYTASETVIKPQRIIQDAYEFTRGEAIVATDVGQHQMWAAQYYLIDKPRRWLTSGGLGTMGFGLPAAAGAAFGAPEDVVLCVTGDGSFQMNIQELATLRQFDLNVKILLLNNSSLGMVRQWQEMFFDKRISHSRWHYNPDFIKVADGYGIPAMQISTPDQILSGLEFLFRERGPALLEVIVPGEEKVFPMIAAGKSQRDIILFSEEREGAISRA